MRATERSVREHDSISQATRYALRRRNTLEVSAGARIREGAGERTGSSEEGDVTLGSRRLPDDSVRVDPSRNSCEPERQRT